MKVPPQSPQTSMDSHYELECSQSRVMTGVCYTAAPSGHPYKALSIQRSPLSPADKCCQRVSGQGRVAGWDDSEVCLGMPGSDWSALVCVCVWCCSRPPLPHSQAHWPLLQSVLDTIKTNLTDPKTPWKGISIVITAVEATDIDVIVDYVYVLTFFVHYLKSGRPQDRCSECFTFILYNFL